MPLFTKGSIMHALPIRDTDELLLLQSEDLIGLICYYLVTLPIDGRQAETLAYMAIDDFHGMFI